MKPFRPASIRFSGSTPTRLLLVTSSVRSRRLLPPSPVCRFLLHSCWSNTYQFRPKSRLAEFWIFRLLCRLAPQKWHLCARRGGLPYHGDPPGRRIPPLVPSKLWFFRFLAKLVGRHPPQGAFERNRTRDRQDFLLLPARRRSTF
jgi:hypothetical protein